MRRGRGPGRAGAIALALAIGCLLAAPPAVAAPPPNDDFENAQVLEGSLPIEVTGTNVEATKEEGEPLHGTFGSKGHSVWFEWEATVTAFVTVGTCGSDFTTVTSVYTGTQVNELTKVAGDYSSEGPGCPSFDGRQITFKAIGGTSYEIAVDGDAFYLPPAEPPSGEGTIELQLGLTPTPPNDDFANAAALIGSIEEEPGAEFAFYWASLRGFNWNATKEEGEPDHGGDPGGASVWYSWTAPGSGTANVGTCEGKPLVVGVYTGDSLASLVPVGSNEFPCAATLTASAGTTYWIAIDGEFNAESGEPALRSFSVNASMQLPPRPHPSEPPPSSTPARDETAPDTLIGKRTLNPAKRRATFSFQSSEAGSTFRCKLDGRPFAACGSPRPYRHLAYGRHTFKVAAIDAAGNADPWPAVSRFKIAKPSRSRL